MNPLAKELNKIIQEENKNVFGMLSNVGRSLFFPKGILSQSAEAKVYADNINATIGIATDNAGTMFLPSIMEHIDDITPEASVNYAPSFGIPALRDAWKDEIYRKNPSLSGKELSRPIVSAGITHGISVVADLFLDPEDIVVLPDMMWGNYSMILSVRKRAEILQYRTFNEKGGYDTAAFEKKITEAAGLTDKIMVIINLPHNPSGYTLNEREAREIARILKKAADGGLKIVAVFDDSYFGLFYDDSAIKESMFTRMHSISDNLLAVKLDGATKEMFAWGLRVGFITYAAKTAMKNQDMTLYEALERKTAGCIRGMISNASHLSQTLVLKSLKDPDCIKEREDKFKILKERALKVKEVLKNPEYKPYFEAYPFNSGYFMCIRLKGDVNAERLRKHLLHEYGIGLISLGDDKLRVAYSSVELMDIPELFNKVAKGMDDLKN